MEGYQFLIDKELAQQTGNVKIDLSYYGFVIDSENPVGGGGGCGSSCSSGSCAC